MYNEVPFLLMFKCCPIQLNLTFWKKNTPSINIYYKAIVYYYYNTGIGIDKQTNSTESGCWKHTYSYIETSCL